MIAAMMALTGAWGQSDTMALRAVGEESKHADADMMMNAHYLGALEGLDIWLTRSDDGVKGFANKRNWHVVKFSDILYPMERVELPGTAHCQVLGAVGAQSNIDGIHRASVLMVDSSARGRITILRARLSMDTLRLMGGRLDTVESYTFGRKDLSKVWCAVSPNGKYLAVLTIVQYVDRKDYISVSRVFDENLNEVWAKDYAVGVTEDIYVDDEGTMYTLGKEQTSNGVRFLMNVMSQGSADSYRMDMQCDPVHDLQIVNVIGKKILCAGLFTLSSIFPDEHLTSGVVMMTLDADSMVVEGFKMRFFQNEDMNIMLNKNTKKFQREHDMAMVSMLGTVRMPYGSVVAVGHHHVLHYTNANGTVTHSYYAKGIQLLAFDTLGNIMWVRNIRRNDMTEISDRMLDLHLFADGDNVCLLKNEHRKEPVEYIITEEAHEYEVGDKSNLVLYTVSPKGDVTKTCLEKETKQALAGMGHRADGSWTLLSFHGSKCRMAVMK